jgi:hypothetical protein
MIHGLKGFILSSLIPHLSFVYPKDHSQTQEQHGKAQQLPHGKVPDDKTQLPVGFAKKFHRKAKKAIKRDE